MRNVEHEQRRSGPTRNGTILGEKLHWHNTRCTWARGAPEERLAGDCPSGMETGAQQDSDVFSRTHEVQPQYILAEERRQSFAERCAAHQCVPGAAWRKLTQDRTQWMVSVSFAAHELATPSMTSVDVRSVSDGQMMVARMLSDRHYRRSRAHPCVRG